jgi:hypothetical protein
MDNMLISYSLGFYFLVFDDVADGLQSIIWVGGESSKRDFSFCDAHDGILSYDMAEYSFKKSRVVRRQHICPVLTPGEP